MKFWDHVLWGLKFVWAFPIPLFALLNRKEYVGPFVFDGNTQHVYIYRKWVFGRKYAFAAWPYIFLPEQDWWNLKLLLHERRHTQHQLWMPGLLWLLSYGLMALVLSILYGFDEAHRRNPWEKDATAYAERKMKEQKARIRRITV